MYLAYNSGSTGTYTLSGSGAVVVAGGNGGGEILGFSGTATFNQTGGTNTIGSAAGVGDFLVGGLAPSHGAYNLSGTGALAVTGIEAVGLYGPGTFTQTGGTNTITEAGGEFGELDLGFYGGTGTYTLSGGSLLASGGVTVGGQSADIASTGVATPVGTGILIVSNGASMTVGGTLTVFNTPSSSINLASGGIINASQLDFNGLPSLFNWTNGTLNITSNVTWDSGAANTTTSDAFLSSLTLGTGQTLMVTGNETLAGAGPFTLTLNNGATHYVTGSVTLNPGGVLTQNAGSTLYFSTFTQAGGTINGNFQNQGVFNYQNGLFNARLINQGSVNLGPSFVAANGIQNNDYISLSAGEVITVNGAGLDNLGSLYLSAATLAGSVVTNDFGGTMEGYGTVSAPFTNDGMLVLAGVMSFTNATAATNIGTITGTGTITGNFSNAGGTINAAPGDLLAISSPWTNAGLVNMQGSSAVLGGGAITNTGTIAGAGDITASIANSTGTISASGGQLILSAAGITNTTGGQIQVASGASILLVQGLATNAGIISLVGGTFDNDGHAMNNTGQITGYGILRTGGLTNNGSITLTGGTSTVNGNITNGFTQAINIKYNPAIFTGNITNNGTIIVTGTTVTFGGSYTGNAYISDPSTNIFQANVTIVPGGTMTGAAGDQYDMFGGMFTNQGTFNNAGILQSSDASTNSGSFTQSGAQSWAPGTTFTNTAGTATFASDAGAGGANLSITATGGLVTFSSTQHLSAVTIGNGGKAKITGTGLVLVTGALTPSGSGQLDMTDNDAIVHNGSLSAITSEIAAGYNFGHWNGSGGITSSTAAGTTNTALGIELNSNDSGGTLVNTFAGQVVTSSDVLIKYTYFGDANLDGVVNGSDYTLIDNGFNNTLTGWHNGDFNYDGVVNGDDYTLIDNAFNTQGASLAADPEEMVAADTAQIAQSAPSVPEPASGVIAMAGAVALLRRARRRRFRLRV